MHQTKFAFLGHHKCATQYVKRICIDVCKILNYSYAMYGHSRLFNHNLPAELESKKVDFLIYTNANYEHFSQIEDQVKAFHVIRDPRDIVVSAYFSHKISHKEQPNLWPELIAYREKLNQ